MHGVLKAPLFAFTLACVAGLSFDAFFIKENRVGETLRILFLHSRRALSRLPPLEGVSNTHWAEKQPKNRQLPRLSLH